MTITTLSPTHTHQAIRERGPYGFTAPVAVEPYTHENRAAHGGVRFVEVCECGYERAYLVNGRHMEMGVWGPSPEMRQAWEEERRQERERAERLDRAAAMLRKPGGICAIGHGITLDVSAARAPVDLLDDACRVRVRLGGPTGAWSRTTVGELRQAERDWRDAPAAAQHLIYSAIAQALP